MNEKDLTTESRNCVREINATIEAIDDPPPFANNNEKIVSALMRSRVRIVALEKLLSVQAEML